MIYYLKYNGRHREDHSLIEDRVSIISLYGGFLLTDFPAILEEVHLYKRICLNPQRALS